MLERAKQELLDIFGERVAFHAIERLLYSGDMTVLPGAVPHQSATPDAVVQPENVEEIVALVQLAARDGIPLTPRGAGAGCHGGAVPARSGIMVDFRRMDRVTEINRDAGTVTVEAGAIWNEVESRLRADGLALRLYPSSAFSSTAGGWLADGGGSGIGSFEYGCLRDNVASVEIVTPAGVRQLAGDDLDLVEGMAGATGFIVRITLLTRQAGQDVPVVASFPDLASLMEVFAEIRESQLPLWDVGYRDPLHARLTEEAMDRQAEYFPMVHAAGRRPDMPGDKFIARFAYPEERSGQVHARLLSIIKSHHGEPFSDSLARFEWAERLYPIRLKALGPSLFISQVALPLAKLPELLGQTTRRAGDIPYSGVLGKDGEQTAVTAYVISDERDHAAFDETFRRSLVPIEIARELGGSGRPTGEFLTGAARVNARAARFKQEVDPGNMLNPGRAFPIEEAAVPAGAPETGGGEGLALESMPFVSELNRDALACSSCGNCKQVCPLFKAVGWESASPRGKFRFLREYAGGRVGLDQRMAEMFFVCTTCRRCIPVCQSGIAIEDHWQLTMRPALWNAGFNPPAILQTQAHNIALEHNPGTNPHSKRTTWMSSDLKYRDEGEVGYFAGCSVSYNYKNRNLGLNAFRILNRAGIEPAFLGLDEWCCGGVMYAVGCADEMMESVEHNIKEINRRGIKTLITSCPRCRFSLAHHYPLFARKLGLEFNVEMKHITGVISELIETGAIKCESPVNVSVAYHDPCLIADEPEPPRKIIASIPALEVVETPGNPGRTACCGAHVKRYPRLGSAINSVRLTEAGQTGAEALVTSCPECETNFRQAVKETESGQNVVDITDLVAQSMGLPLLSTSMLAKLLRSKKSGAKNG
ncbi:MAG: FAD-binding oxidoreductase [Chloroflexi bacterium]|nr:FAD-binding oxidoreductase [Chloroflexota bacterium]